MIIFRQHTSIIYMIVMLSWLGIGKANCKVIDIEYELGEKRNLISRIPGCEDYAWDFYHDRRLLTTPREYPLPTGGWSVDVCFRLDDIAGTSCLLGSNRWGNFTIFIREGMLVGMNYHTSEGRKTAQIPCQVEIGIWHHLAVTQDASAMAHFYLDGKLIGMSAMGAMPSQSAHVGTVGCHHIDSRGKIDHVFKGCIDRPRLHDKALTAEEIHDDWFETFRTLSIVPMPRQFHASGEVAFPIPKTIGMKLDDTILPEGHLARRVLEQTFLKLGVQGKTEEEGVFRLAVYNLPQEDIPKHLSAYLSGKRLPTDGYLMDIDKSGIAIYADTTRGALYAILALRDVLKLGDVHPGVIFDWPEFPMRAALVVVDSEPPVILGEHLRRQIDELAELRIKYVMLRSHDWAMLDRPEVRNAVEKVVDYVAENEMVVIPYLQTYSHAKGCLFVHPEYSHTRTISGEKVEFHDGYAVLAKHNVVNHAETPVVVAMPDGTVLEEGRDYTVEITAIHASWKFPPESKAQFTWAKPFVDENGGVCTIKALTGGRLEKDATAIVTYDISAKSENTCPFLAEYRGYLKDCIRKSLEITGSDFINMGLDEIWTPRGEGRCCSSHPATVEETFVFAFNDIQKMIHDISPGIKMLAFSDMLDPRQTPGWKRTDVTPHFDRAFSKEIVMMPWYYGDGYAIPAVVKGSVMYFLERGFPVVGTAGKIPLNQIIWGETLLPLRGKYPVDGFFYTMWDDANHGLPRSAGYHAYSQMVWSPDRLFAPSLMALERLMRIVSSDSAGAYREQVVALLPIARREYVRLTTWFPLTSLGINGLDKLEEALRKADNYLNGTMR